MDVKNIFEKYSELPIEEQQIYIDTIASFLNASKKNHLDSSLDDEIDMYLSGDSSRAKTLVKLFGSNVNSSIFDDVDSSYIGKVK